MHFLKINIVYFDFCIDYVINIDITNEFYNIKINQNEKNNNSDHCICATLYYCLFCGL